MHEVFITRGDAMGISNEDDRYQIYDCCNCVLVHHGECHGLAATEAGKAKCARQIIHHEGLGRVFAFLDAMKAIFKNPALPQSEWLYVFLLSGDEEYE